LNEHVRVVRVVGKADLRGIHKVARRVSRTVRVGECVVFINRKADKGRIIAPNPSVKGYMVLNLYRFDNLVYDVPEIQRQLSAGFKILIDITASNASHRKLKAVK